MTLPLLLAFMQTTSDARFVPGAGGEPPVWLVNGPLPRDRWERPGIDEATLRPAEGDLGPTGKPWIADAIDPRIGIDFRALLKSEAEAVVYAYAEFSHPTATDALLLFGSDDGAKVFVDGRTVFETRDYRGVVRDQDRVPIRLNAGVTRVLFKVDQYRLGWGLTARVVGTDGKPLPGLRVIQRLRSGPEAFRGGIGRPGSLDLLGARRFADGLGLAERWTKAFPGETTDALRSAIADARAVDGRDADLDALNTRRSVASERLSKALEAARRPMVARFQRPGPLLPNVDAKKEAFVRPMRGGRYFEAGGKPFTPISVNHNIDWTEFAKADPLSPEHDPTAANRFMAKYAKSGVNVVRIMVETPPSGNLEERVGTFRPEHVMWLDAVVLAARKHGVRVWLTPYDTFWMNLRADASPYWIENGGFVDPKNKVAWYTDPRAIAAQRRRMEYLIDRYGNLGTVFAWEIMNEADIWWDPPMDVLRAWTGPALAHARDHSRRRWGVVPMMTMSMAEPEAKGDKTDIQYRFPGFDFATNHLYVGRTRATKPGQERGAGEDFARGVRHGLAQIRDRRPLVEGESGPIDEWVKDVRLDDRTHKEMSWAHLMAGGAGAGTRWPYRNPHHVTDGMLRNLREIAEFSRAVDWRSLTGDPRRLSGPGLEGVATPRAVIARVRDGATLREQGRYRVWDVVRGRWTGPERTGVVTIPPGVTDSAITLRR